MKIRRPTGNGYGHPRTTRAIGDEGLFGWRDLPISKRELGRDFGAWFRQDGPRGVLVVERRQRRGDQETVRPTNLFRLNHNIALGQ
ncbi:hypothetical protein [Pseudonocardia charpentierae]|uniref:Uncharacterized protein n=1 Tax=Pseudonocardia charpentierae TaxID=3075545 RepID=A0ABU2NHK2_9PSEU|nr:hypothetical protein [Pseudonocardia sp. DSM 45834]MDT0353052.1 hypothetical protein [Pseudonocardia sp. DSM 45834]